jgi:hypothetical protein
VATEIVDLIDIRISYSKGEDTYKTTANIDSQAKDSKKYDLQLHQFPEP